MSPLAAAGISASSSACRHAWEQRQLGEVAEICRGLTYSPSALSDSKDGVRVLRSSNIDDGIFTIHDDDVFVSRSCINVGYIQRNDILMTAANGSNALVGKHAIIPAVSVERMAPGGFMYRLHSEQPTFLNSYFSSPSFNRFLSSHVLGGDGSIGNLSRNDLAAWFLSIPNDNEQRRIGEFFSTLDSLIAAAERQEALLKQKKQAYLQLMFPQEGEAQPRLKFNGFSGEWESLQLGKLYEKNTERNGNQFDAGKTLSVSSMTFNAFGNGAAEESLTTYKVLRIGDAAFEGHTSNEFAFGRFVVNTIGDGIMSPRFTAIRPTARWRQSCDLDFWSCYLHDENVMKRILVRSTKRGTMMNELVLDDFFTERIRVPSLPEQRHIGKFFSTLDSLIAASEKRTASLHALKSAYLQRMFV
ncbi:restriction endonuclease subunit S [Pseudoscardovia radai]|uniref:restriction endonuclease subunit S n=1 Tax=Pseudoscardovia radai TaxID=987066 RepID=UPI003995550F